MNRRSFLLGLAAGLAPAVIRTPGLLMPVKALHVVTRAEYEALASDFDFTTANLIARAHERWSVAWCDWCDAYASLGYAPIVEG